MLFDRLAQRVERLRRELAQLVEEQRTAVGERHLSGAQPGGPAPDQGGGRRRVMGRPERAVPGQPVLRRVPGDRMDACHLERLAGVERRQDRREPSRQHRLAGTGRAGEQYVVPAGRCDLERAPRTRQAPHVGEVDCLVVEPGHRSRVTGRGDVRPFGLALQARTELADVPRRAHVDVVHERGLGRVGSGHDHRSHPGAAECVDEGQDAWHRTHRPVEPQLAEHTHVVEDAVGELAARRQQTERDCELEPGAGLADATRREVDGDALERELELRRQQRRPHPLARLPDRGVRQPHDLVAGQAGRHVDLDGHDATVDAGERGAANRCEHGEPPENVRAGGP